MSKKKTIIISLAILLTASVVTLVIFLTEPTAEKQGATKKTAMLVEVDTIYKGNFIPVIKATGTVAASQDIILSPRVSGEVIKRSADFVPGGYIKKGQMVLQIDPKDYKNALELRKSDLQQALADLRLEMGRQDVAKKDFQLVNDSLSDENKALILREPQLESVKARVEAARAEVNQAKLELNRTTIRAPFNAHVISRNVNVGSLVATGQELGRIVGKEMYWVVTTVPVAKLKWLSFSDTKNREGSGVIIRNTSAWEQDEFREGYLFKLIGALDDQTRLAKIIVAAPDPMAQLTENKTKPELMLGTFVETTIHARELKDVFRINRDYLHDEQTVWIMEQGKLKIRKVTIILKDQDYAYISEGVSDGDLIVTTNLTTVNDGAPLRTTKKDSIK